MSTLINSDVVKSAIARRISTKYSNTDIYKEQVVEGLTYPSFFINQVLLTPTNIFKNQYMYEFMMSINYFVDDNITNAYQEIDNVGCELVDLVSSIYIDGLKIKGKNIQTQKSDGVGVTNVTYTIPVREIIEDGVKMQYLDITTNLKN